MPIVRKYGQKAVAGLAQKAGEAKSNMMAAEVQNQVVQQQMQQQYAQAQLDAKLKSDLQRTVLQNDMEMQKDQQRVLEQQARDRMLQDWEVQKLQMASQTDFALREKEYTLKNEYMINQRMQDQIDADNKAKQLDKDLAAGRIDNKVKRASGLTEYEELYNQIQFSNRPMKQSSEDQMANLFMQALNPAGTPTDSPASPVQQPMTTGPAVTGSLWWKKIHPEAIDPVLKNSLNLPQLSPNDKAAIGVLLNSPNSQIVLEQKLKLYNKLMALMGNN